MDLSFIAELVSPLTLVICLVIGYVIKNCIKNETINHFIPIIVAITGVIICAWDTMAFTPTVIAAGLISGLASTGLYEACTQLLNLNDCSE